ncbi:TonB-linked SusC/RagA family outer membrane protein [Hymenobacter luteus]|uniref:TonB-linked SusC/RagA family outer membrane protein n=2 Tax=Hymenobacter TaxID=89966 RepID=A0A7W9WB49_9BACT|nr:MULTISPECIES: SusC/RagA family TonB-linked outer membrane protein [Hymenobacter]MBB4599665.1 TonB-linked SusC/RagA family outer membrane protein [Hymenobacter latericoloratus]MBB6058025.1 TonB-linked SusC/RagA family outer membrane protein [Hymenobacter luteus]
MAQILTANYHRILPFQPLQEQLRQVAGVQATPYSGAPGAQVAVRIRGAASLSSNAQPLYVVDGMPVFQNTFRPGAGNSLTDVVPAEVQELDNNPLLSIPSEDIEQVEILKGVYETALYGSQGLNGVIRITTRRGQAGKPRLSYSGYGGVQRARTRYDLLDAQEYATLRNEVSQRIGRPLEYSPAQLAALGAGTDWQNELLRTAAVQEHHLGLAGGTAATRYYAAAGYLGQEGVVLNSRLRRYAARAALNQQLGRRLRLDATGSFSQTSQRIPNYYALQNALLAPPTQALTDNPNSGYYVNPVDQARQSFQSPEQQRLLAQAGARYELVTGLTLDVRANLERATLRSRSYLPAFSNFPAGESGNLTFTYRQWIANPALRYARTIGGERHAVTASLETLHQNHNSTAEQHSYIPGSAAGGGSGSRGSNSSFSQATLSFYQLTGSYTFNDRYQVRGTLRRDGSSTFAPNNRWHWLPGAEVRWHAAKEKFWATAPARLDVWAGWGRSSGAGNEGRNSLQIFVPGPRNTNQRISLFLPEQSQQIDAGLEAGLLNNHLTVTAQAYMRRTASAAHAPGQLTSNNSAPQDYVRNAGLELTLQGTWTAGKLQGSSRLAAATNRNRYEAHSASYFSTYQRTADGHPLSTFYGYRTQGLDASGNLRYEDVNGNGQLDFPDQQPLGGGLPKQLLSFGQQLTLGRLEAQVQADAMLGYQVQNTALLYLDAPTSYHNASGRVRARWTPANPAAEVPAAGSEVSAFSTYTLQSGNHARLSALMLSYKVWERETRSVRIWLGGHNLLVLTKYRGYDPNVSSAGSDNQQAGLDAGAYPTARTLVVGLRATL